MLVLHDAFVTDGVVARHFQASNISINGPVRTARAEVPDIIGACSAKFSRRNLKQRRRGISFFIIRAMPRRASVHQEGNRVVRFFLCDIQTACLTIGDDGALGNRSGCSFNPQYRKRRKFFLIHRQPPFTNKLTLNFILKHHGFTGIFWSVGEHLDSNRSQCQQNHDGDVGTRNIWTARLFLDG